VIRAYSADEEMVDAVLIRSAEAQTTVEKFLATPDVAFVQVRFPTRGCFAMRIDRA
jgi:hypothetical protein